MRAVLDPNVLISGALAPRGTPAQVLRELAGGRYEAVLSEALLAELERALAYPKLRARITAADAAALVDWLRSVAVLAADPSDPPPVGSRDPGDDSLIALAADRRAVIVTGDADLLELGDRIPVFSPADFLALLASGDAG